MNPENCRATSLADSRQGWDSQVLTLWTVTHPGKCRIARKTHAAGWLMPSYLRLTLLGVATWGQVGVIP